MPFLNLTSYVFELWSNNGTQLADISAIATNRNYTIIRNGVDELTLDLDLFAWEAFAKQLGADPRSLITPYQSNVRIKRNGTYLYGFHIVAAPLNIGTDFTMSTSASGNDPSSFNPTITVICKGYESFFTDRYVTVGFTGAERTTVARALISTTQGQIQGDFGVTMDAQQYDTGVADAIRNYTLDNVRTSIENLSRLPDAPFDFSYTSDKKFQTWKAIGSPRTDLAFTYGGPASNIIGLYDENSATSLYNRIIALGSGFGPDQLQSYAEDLDSKLNNYLRETITQHNSDALQATLDKNAAADLVESRRLLNLPQITISGKELEGVPFLSVGDRIPLSFPGHPYLTALAGTYRIEQFTVDLDDNDFEQSIRIYFDNYNLVA